ncbi:MULTISPECIES: porphobilinogen synthase [Metallosphaera]|uniref:Delta-aminolevulinic acid dehydratase n=3 Tax=Metallosphaera TaxID=41980 RepID=A4YD90_METS5|nr:MULTISPECIES: porphobilinogen synthase [Metallosphaera]ABP94392.1 porphobilinogen synthase [Metallosphaera sedula DSM 5348]AIM26379.1 porphobilinogen synthase [Metallosphaera sedula]AKV73385.1 delta-aminolevulinic acid dehydratase [Metallosphaera sedula]AKV75629.1 delta-aminolevulinic acid dehydratase [Metallosphaera sedula]AKV77875.1 delta-aminolevulinic acid dehydratase [Metallosphaera sedula]
MVGYPKIRPRRLRQNKNIRDAVAETKLTHDNLILPIFVKEGISKPEEISSMPDVYRYPVGDPLIKFVEGNYSKGIRKVILFGIPSFKDNIASSAYQKDGVIQRSLKLLKETFGDKILLFADECTDEYTSHGHCGIVNYRGKQYYIDNDESLKVHAKIALSQAEAGADVIAPSSMMDGVVGAIREELDRNGFTDTLIMSYSVKYASVFYSPFREAASSAPAFGDRKSYQMDPRNANEAIKEARLDLEEGADILMVKPAHTYLDVIRLVKETYPEYPLAAYHVSGEYSMIKAAAINGWLNEKVAVLEITHAIRRAGADMILTYYAPKLAEWILEASPF